MKVGTLQMQHNINSVNLRKRVSADSNPGKIDGKNQVELKKSFTEILSGKIDEKVGLQFSSHALRRLDERQINLTSENLTRLKDGVDRVKEKGGRSSLILMDDTAYIVSVKNKTVVTTLETERTKNNVFTNIDTVAIV